MIGAQIVMPLVGQLAEEWKGLTGDDQAMIEEGYPNLVRPLEEVSVALVSVSFEVAGAPTREPPAAPTLAAALALADHLTPSPTEAHAALRVMRQALADALAVTVSELQHQSAGYPAGRI